MAEAAGSGKIWVDLVAGRKRRIINTRGLLSRVLITAYQSQGKNLTSWRIAKIITMPTTRNRNPNISAHCPLFLAPRTFLVCKPNHAFNFIFKYFTNISMCSQRDGELPLWIQLVTMARNVTPIWLVCFEAAFCYMQLKDLYPIGQCFP